MGQTVSSAVASMVSRDEYDNVNRQRLDAERQLKKSKIDYLEREGVINRIRTTLLKTRDELSEMQQAYIDTKKLYNESKNKYELILAEADELKKTNENIQEQLLERENDVSKLKKENIESKNVIKTSQNKLETLLDEVNEKDKNIESFKKKNGELRAQAIKTQEELNQFTADISKINNIVDSRLDKNDK